MARDSALATTDPIRATPLPMVLEAWRTIPGQFFAIGTGFGLIWGLANGLGWWLGHGSSAPLPMTAHFVYEAVLPMLALVLCIAVADAATHGEPGRMAPYAIAAVTAALVGEAVFIATVPLLGLESCHCTMEDWPRGSRIANMLPDSLIICGFVTAGYRYWRRAALRTARLHAAELERTRVTRQTLESRLQVMQACIEPQFLFDTLAQVERLHSTDPKTAIRLLDELIVYLRAALPHLRETTSTVGKETGLAAAYLNILRLRQGGGLTFTIEVDADAQDATMPPMLLLPLIDRAIGDQSQSPESSLFLRIAVRVVDDRLRLALTAAGSSDRHDAPDGITLTDLGERLAMLYGGNARLDVRTDDRQQYMITLEIPHEQSDRHNR